MFNDKPFTVRHIGKDNEDLSDKPLISSRVEIPLQTLIKHCEDRDMLLFLNNFSDDHKIALDADFFMRISEAPPKVAKNESAKLIIPFAIIFGIIIGILLFVPFYFGVSFAMFALVSVLVFLVGILIGWTSAKRYMDRMKALFNIVDGAIEGMRKRMLS